MKQMPSNGTYSVILFRFIVSCVNDVLRCTLLNIQCICTVSIWPQVCCRCMYSWQYIFVVTHSKCLSLHHFKGSSEDTERRRSSERERKRKPMRFQSPSEDELKTKKKRRRRLNPLLRIPRRDPGIPFKCDLCGSPYVINPSRRGNRPKLSSHHPSPRHKVDPATGKTLTLCNACGRFILHMCVLHVVVWNNFDSKYPGLFESK